MQIVFEMLVGVCRYVNDMKYGIRGGTSRDDLDFLEGKGCFSEPEQSMVNRIFEYRTKLVHNHLQINQEITRAIIARKDDQSVKILVEKLFRSLETELSFSL